MSAADTIRRAIDKLETQRDAATPAPWRVRHVVGTEAAIDAPWTNPQGETFDIPIITGGDYAQTEGTVELADADLIVTLHRTIDVQLTILRHVIAHYSGDLGIGTNRRVVDLARAILGEDV